LAQRLARTIIAKSEDLNWSVKVGTAANRRQRIGRIDGNAVMDLVIHVLDICACNFLATKPLPIR
jgi:hypothetical protein